MIGFKYNGIHSSTMKVGMRSVERSLIPAKRKNEYVIPGRHGTVDYGENTYEKRNIEIEIALLNSGTFEELRERAREVARWLSEKGLLVFDDEPNKAYNAQLYDSVGIDQLNRMPKAVTKVKFEAQPFAETENYNQSITDITLPTDIKVTSSGTQEAKPIIIIKNTGTTNITGITIQRKAGV